MSFGGASAWGQAALHPGASPLAPGDLSKPIFDTAKPEYDTSQARRKSAGTIVAEVDGRAITLADVRDAIQALPANLRGLPFQTIFPTVMDQLVRQEALVVAAQRAAVDEDADVRRRMKNASDQVLATQYLQTKVLPGITEQMVLDRYRRDVAGRPGPEEVRVRVIMTPTAAEAAALIEALRTGGDFSAIARRESKDTTSIVGGDLGFVRRDGLNAEIGAVAFALPVGQISAYPVRSAGNWFIVKVEERRTQPPLTLSEARNEITQALVREGSAPLVRDALADVVVRQYNITGKEGESEAVRVP
ncbi:MAG: peptidyl-prolyl cis-trans isomerase [Acetobacteraceae bacterium]